MKRTGPIAGRIFLAVTHMRDSAKVLDYLEWTYDQAYGPERDRDAPWS